MCGVIGLISKEKNMIDGALSTLKRLEYRGYDSSGIGFIQSNELKVIKKTGKIINLENACKNQNLESEIVIGHTRWATHGKVTEANAHPHFGTKVAVIHNGIIENYAILKDFLTNKGFEFKTETDTEVIPHYIEYRLGLGDSFTEAFRNTIKELKGAFAILAIYQDQNNIIAFAKQGSPLVIGKMANGYCLGSDAFSLIEFTNSVIYLEDGDFGFVDADGLEIFDKNLEKVTRAARKTDAKSIIPAKDGYKHYMIKEINEQPIILRSIINKYINSDYTINLNIPEIDIAKFKRVSFIACGTSYYAAMIAGQFFPKYAGVNVEYHIASEFRYQEYIIEKDTLYVAISQSGETADTIACLKYIKSNGGKILGLVNAESTTMETIADEIMQLECGAEISVASTKALSAQILCLEILALKIGSTKGSIDKNTISEVIQDAEEAIKRAGDLLKNQNWIDGIRNISSKISEYKSLIYLGRNTAGAIAAEGALKMKELSYIHCEAMPAGELKHGPIALIDKNIPVICLAPNHLFDKTASNIENIFSRDGRIVLISDKSGLEYFSKFNDQIIGSIEVDSTKFETIAIQYAIVMQLLSYFTAIEKGCDVDQPRNLAKSVTVE